MIFTMKPFVAPENQFQKAEVLSFKGAINRVNYFILGKGRL